MGFRILGWGLFHALQYGSCTGFVLSCSEDFDSSAVQEEQSELLRFTIDPGLFPKLQTEETQFEFPAYFPSKTVTLTVHWVKLLNFATTHITASVFTVVRGLLSPTRFSQVIWLVSWTGAMKPSYVSLRLKIGKTASLNSTIVANVQNGWSGSRIVWEFAGRSMHRYTFGFSS